MLLWVANNGQRNEEEMEEADQEAAVQRRDITSSISGLHMHTQCDVSQVQMHYIGPEVVLWERQREFQPSFPPICLRIKEYPELKHTLHSLGHVTRAPQSITSSQRHRTVKVRLQSFAQCQTLTPTG